ncbi:hypothetical protein AB4Z19_15745 [Pseudoduganella sp. RAF19]|uniref:hypothetical protein n=2 Tax=unclassified Pseudoduganella TaxID=2637179 RepID=UPI003F988C9D
MLGISIRSNLRELQRSFDAVARRQVPFATASALTSLAKRVKAAEQTGMRRVLDRPTPFTINSVGVRAARKTDPTATVFIKDVAATYLEPFEFGGTHKLSARGLANPKAAGVNQYGNLPRTMIARLKSRGDVFIGAVKTKSGETINGVWQRPSVPVAMRGRRLARGSNDTGRLKLLIRFTDPEPVTQRLNYRERAKRLIAAQFDREFSAAMAKALANARP